MPKPDQGEEWIELYNSGIETVELTDWKLVHVSQGRRFVYVIPLKTTIEGKGHQIFYANLTKIMLSDEGGEVQLLYPDPADVIADMHVYGTPEFEQTSARSYDGGDPWTTACEPTPNAGNCIAPFTHVGVFGIGLGLMIAAISAFIIGLAMPTALLLGGIVGIVAGLIAMTFRLGNNNLLIIGIAANLLAALFVFLGKRK